VAEPKALRRANGLQEQQKPLLVRFQQKRGGPVFQRRRHGHSHAPRSHHVRHPKSYKVACSGCGKEVVIPVLPPDDKELLCIACFSKSGISKEET